MTTQHIDGFVLTPGGFIRGVLEHDKGRVVGIDGSAVPEHEARHGAQDLPLILPGFIDTHVHGGAGRDTMEGGDAAARLAQLHARHGTTSLLATTMTAPLDEIRQAMRALAPTCVERPAGGARVLGVHLEGPYINPGKLGAQPDFAKAASIDEIRALHALAPIRLITLAPELPGNLELVERLSEVGFRIQIGHTLGTYEDGVAALARGAGGFTHLFNAMTGLHHREPGMVGAALAHARYAEIIPDLLHVHPGAIRVALRSIPHLFCVTDSTAAAGMPDGEYRLGRHRVTKCLGGVRLPDGTLAGSTLTMDQALRNLVLKLGLSIEDASRRVSTNAADYLGLDDRGRLAPGAWADFVVMDRGLQLHSVVVEGEAIDLAHAG
ncbi:N-acetylglucosamine-6-phosphate deacetylase [Mitsuaria sp. BK045]|jgi:N-acetylglucosamine-6-phosphate deacetylase|uniref:N-acetylglucosamine-6-phosphate deacetylase n=1 Tax=unclassified Roseateles TaxID=2626991 RepID=UPI001619F1E5|nr:MULTISPECIES: N-acetylglucosamine-6-phosphate deacetylase [unclassified Roseateles]MBB3295439.1 N-acetylglucosamine-6-phosphate deacetylase [Mitsuaria sp. BK041]MBB3364655.1 N-acetylglucosamine-6-phosphate deacetylase [Mitsuaria sp. BK045]